jgi:hypothetical protein
MYLLIFNDSMTEYGSSIFSHICGSYHLLQFCLMIATASLAVASKYWLPAAACKHALSDCCSINASTYSDSVMVLEKERLQCFAAGTKKRPRDQTSTLTHCPYLEAFMYPKLSADPRKLQCTLIHCLTSKASMYTDSLLGFESITFSESLLHKATSTGSWII